MMILFIQNYLFTTFVIAQTKPGASSTELYLNLLKGKNIGVVANQTSVIGSVSLVDTLVRSGITIKKIFCPEHGFRGNADAGAKLNDDMDKQTGLPIVSLYGKHFKPTAEDLSGLDIVVYDLQDVGVRFYTYISTLTYVMEACALNNVQVMVLDRPNPNGFYVDGPILKACLCVVCRFASYSCCLWYDTRRICPDGKWRRVVARSRKVSVASHSIEKLGSYNTLSSSGKTITQSTRYGCCLYLSYDLFF